jgi:hypothetical protein
MSLSNLSRHLLGLAFTPGHWPGLLVILVLWPCIDCTEAKEGILLHNKIEVARLYTLTERYSEALDLCREVLTKYSKRSDFIMYFTTQFAIANILYCKDDCSEAAKLLGSVLLEQPPPMYEHEFKSLLARCSDDANITLDDDQLYGHWYSPALYGLQDRFSFVQRFSSWKNVRQWTASELLGKPL